MKRIVAERRYVRVNHELTTLDDRSGEPFRWNVVLDEAAALEHVRKVNAGEMRDPLSGKLWPKTRAWIVGER
jgi:hypothetical protein